MNEPTYVPDFREELDECLEILGHYADRTPVYDDGSLPYGESELVTACWQSVELVSLLLADNDAAWDAVMGLRVMVNELQTQLAQREGRIWTPGQGGSSGQSRSPRRSRHS